MGNRAVVVFTDGKQEFSPAIYLHWNGGADSVYAFLTELDRRKVRADQCYEAARFVGIVTEFFDQDGYSTLSIGLANGPKSDDAAELAKIRADLSDNGIYLVNRTRDGQPRRVRRFTYGYPPDGDRDKWPWPMVEWDEVKVRREYQEALTGEDNGHYRAVRVFFETTGKSVSKYG